MAKVNVVSFGGKLAKVEKKSYRKKKIKKNIIKSVPIRNQRYLFQVFSEKVGTISMSIQKHITVTPICTIRVRGKGRRRDYTCKLTQIVIRTM